MSDNNSTLFPLSSLPVSSHRLLDFHSLQHLRCNPAESVFIHPPPEVTGFGTDADLFKHPFQVAILGINGDQVDLGVYAHPSLQVRQGPAPTKSWRRKCRKALTRWGTNGTQTLDVKTRLLHLCDEIYRLRSLHLYCYESLDDLIDAEGNDNDPSFLAGLRQILNWVIQRDKTLHTELNRLLENLRSDSASTAGKTVKT